MNPLPKRQESNEAANPRLHQAFMSPLMIALPASSTHTQDMFDQLRTAAELELIEITAFIQDKLGFNISTRFLKIIKREGGLNKVCIDNAVMTRTHPRRKKISKRIKIQSPHSGIVLKKMKDRTTSYYRSVIINDS